MPDFVVTAREALSELIAAEHEVLSAFAPQQAIAILDTQSERGQYHEFPAELTALWRSLESRFGAAGFRAFQCATMLTLIVDFERRGQGWGYTDAILERFDFSYRRIMRHVQDPAYAEYASAGGLLFKDLALCTHKMFPAGAQVVEPTSAFHRALLFRGGVG